MTGSKFYTKKNERGLFMFTEASMITLLGMGSVFFFLILLVCFMNLSAYLCKVANAKDINKVALAVVLARTAQKGKK